MIPSLQACPKTLRSRIALSTKKSTRRLRIVSGEQSERRSLSRASRNSRNSSSLHNPLISKERTHFRKYMLDLAREGGNEEGGWEFFCKTNAPAYAGRQLDVYQRDVPWSSIPHLRTVVDADVDAKTVLRYMLHDSRKEEGLDDAAAKAGISKTQRKALGRPRFPFKVYGASGESMTGLQYRMNSLPW